METKIAVLRGINVGGKRKLLMADLKSMCEDLGCNDVATYIQSGNVIFRSDKENRELADALQATLKKKYNYDVPVVVRSSMELEKSIKNNPFYSDNADVGKLHLTFLKEKPTKENKQITESYNFEPDKFIVMDKDIFLYCEGKYHETKLSNVFFEKKLNVEMTTRNWKTVLKLMELCKTFEG